MSQGSTTPKFKCTACNKEYVWKPAIAGKSGKCSACGQTIKIPATAPEPDPLDGLYDLAEPAATSSAPAAVAQRVVPVDSTMSASAGTSRAIEYQHTTPRDKREAERFTYDDLTDPVRDLYVPVGLLVAGFFGAIAWAIYHFSGKTSGMVAVTVLLGTTTVVKTAVMVGLAIIVAPKMGISFGTLWTGVMKFAGILIFTDMALLWVNSLIGSIGGAGGRTMYVPGTFRINLLLATGLITVSSFYLFDMDGSETGMFALPMALVSRVVDFVVYMIILGVLHGIVTAAGARGARPSAISISTSGNAGAVATTQQQTVGSSSSAATATPVATQLDTEIQRRIQRGKGGIREGRDWELHQIVEDRATKHLIEDMYNAGAMKVHIDSLLSGGLTPALAYIELPTDPARRGACTEVAKKYYADNNLPDLTARQQPTQIFLIVRLAPPHKKH